MRVLPRLSGLCRISSSTRHDLCYQGGTTSRLSCDNALLREMDQNCEHYYGVFSLLRAACKSTALVYWAAVVAT
jgi:hypothetical protein